MPALGRLPAIITRTDGSPGSRFAGPEDDSGEGGHRFPLPQTLVLKNVHARESEC